MRYHDLKIRDAGRLAALAFGLITIVGLSLAFRDSIEPILDRLYPRSREPFVPVMIGLTIGAALCGGGAVHYLRTSPAQNAEFIDRMASKGHYPGEKFDPSLLDPSDPDFYTTTWAYLRRRWMAVR